MQIDGFADDGHDPAAWYWRLKTDGRIWSSAAGAFVDMSDPARTYEIDGIESLHRLLSSHGLTSPLVTADDIRAEAQRRIIALTGASDLDTCMIRQLNALMRAAELTNKRVAGLALTDDEEEEAAALQALADAIKAIRAASNAMEASPPDDYLDAARWPAAS